MTTTLFPKIDNGKLNETILKISQVTDAFMEIASNNAICQAGEDIYGNYRGFCSICHEKCPSYTQSGLNELNCARCSCGASAHKLLSLDETEIIGFNTSVKNDIFPKLTQSMTDSQLNFNCFLVLYKMINRNATKSQFSWLFQLLREAGFKIHRVEIKTLKDENDKGLINNLNDNLNDFYNPSSSIIPKEKNEASTLNKYSITKSFLDKSNYNKKDTTFKSLSKIESQFKYFVTDKEAMKSTIKINEDLRGSNLYKSFMTQKMKSIIHEKVRVNKNLYEEFSHPVLALCLSLDTDNHIHYFEKFNNAINHYNTLIKNQFTSLKLLYYSKSKLSALWDIQIIFPELFRITKLCQLITAKPNNPSEFKKVMSSYNDSLQANSIHVIDSHVYSTYNDLKANRPFFQNNARDTSVSSAIYQLNYVGDSDSMQMATTLGFNPYLDIINYSLEEDYAMMTNEFFENTMQYERILVIFRPFILRNSLNEVLLNILRINGFYVLTRKTAILSKEQLSFLYMKEFPSNGKIAYEDYEYMMTDGNCELIVLSKFSAVKDANSLLGFNHKEINVNLYNSIKSSLAFSQLKIENERTNKKLQKSNAIHKDTLSQLFSPIEPQRPQVCFKDIASLINFNSIMASIAMDKQNLSIGNLYSEIKIIKNNLLKIASYLNLFAYHTKEFPSNEEDVIFFFPHFGEMEEALLIVKDYHKAEEIFDKMKYEIIDSKSIRLNQDDFEALFDEYLTNENVSPSDYSSTKEYAMNNDICLIRVIKPSAFYELKKIIGRENYMFLLNNNKYIDSTDHIGQLKQIAYLLDNSIHIEYYYSILNDKIKIIEGSSIETNRSNNISQILNSCLKCTVGENIRFDKKASIRNVHLIERYLAFYNFDLNEREKEYFVKALNNFMFPKHSLKENSISVIESKFIEVLSSDKCIMNTHLSFFLESTSLGFYEIRIPVFERMTADGWMYLDMKDLIIKRNYLYVDTPFYQDLVAKNSDKILYSFFPFEKGSLGSFLNFKDTSDTIAKSIIGFNSVAFDKANLNILKSAMDFSDNEVEMQRRILYTTKYESTKLFYKSCALSKNSDNIIPQSYHYRIKPDDIYMNISRIYEVEEFGGLFFIEAVIQDFMKYRVTEQNIKIENDEVHFYNDPYNTWYGRPKVQFSLSAYLWGRKLLNLCACVENMEKCQVDNYGPIIYLPKKQKIAGIINQVNIKEYEMYLYMNIIEDIRQFGFEFLPEKDIELIENKIIEVFNSEIFNSTRAVENARLMPCRITETNLRINKNKPLEKNNPSIINNKQSKVSNVLASSINNAKHELEFHSLFKKKEDNEYDEDKSKYNESFINPSIVQSEYVDQKDDISKDILSKNLILIDLFCYIGMKYHIYASVLFLLKVFFRKISRKSNLITLPIVDEFKSESEYDKLLDAMIEGFQSHSHINSAALNDIERYNAYYIEYFFYCLKEVKYHMNEIELIKEKLAKCEELLASKQKKDDEYFELLKVHDEMNKALKEHLVTIEIIINEARQCPLKKTEAELNNIESKYVPKERYHIPMYMKEKWERNMDNPKYVLIEKVNNQLSTNLNSIQEKEKRNIYASTGFEVKNDFYLVKKSLLREPEPVPDNQILISKKKNEKKENPHKIFSSLIKAEINNELEEKLNQIEANKGAQTNLTYEDYLIYLESKPQFKNMK